MDRSQARQICRDLFLNTLSSLKIGPRMRQCACFQTGILKVAGDSYDLSLERPIRVIAVGKAANEMAETAAELLAPAKFNGIVVSPVYPNQPNPQFKYFQGGHPYPNQQSLLAAEAVMSLLDHRNISANDLVLFLISGGGSALLEMPLKDSRSTMHDVTVSLDDLRSFYEILVTCGASIQEINTVRKHLSAVKGGRLAHAAWPASQITLYVSDVPEHLPSMVASGPTMPDESTIEDCANVLSRYGLLDLLPGSIRMLWQCVQDTETPKPGHPCFTQSRYYCLMSNRDGIDKILELASNQGLLAEADISCDDWDFRGAADYLINRLEILQKLHPGRSVAIISGGELSCPVTGSGMGGRNQAFVLDCVAKIAGKLIVVLSAGTDGIDGNSPSCGAIADGTTAYRAASIGLDPATFLSQSDSFHFFKTVGDELTTGPTGTNVRDLRILIGYDAIYGTEL